MVCNRYLVDSSVRDIYKNVDVHNVVDYSETLFFTLDYNFATSLVLYLNCFVISVYIFIFVI